MKRLLRVIFFLAHYLCVFALSTEFTLFSWNLLAPEYSSPSKFPATDEQHLDWKYREPLILRKIEQRKSSIVCLQEVQLDLWPAFKVKLKAIGYCGSIQTVSPGHPVACAVLVKEDFGTLEEVESRSRALICVLKKHGSEEPLFLANVHLEAGFGKESDSIRFCQIKSLLKRINNHVKEYSSSDRPFIVLAGDFNMIANNPVYELLSSGQLPKKQEVTKRNVVNVPLLPVHDAYKLVPPEKGPVHKTYRNGYVLDYIWTSKAVQVVSTWQSHDDAVGHERAQWPSYQHPSDHLPVGATLALLPKN